MMRWSLWCFFLFIVTVHQVTLATADDNANDDDAAANTYYTYAADDDGAGYAYSQTVEPCEKGVVQVTSISLLCNSPYTFYYGNGANRNSAVCDYGDKANIEISFTVTDDLDEGSDIYMKMAVEYKNEQLYVGDAVELCNNYVGGDCTAAGDYTFKKKIQFAYIDGTYSKFVPTLEIAFSDSDDGSYRLGGVNIYCEEDEQEDDAYVVEDWSDGSNVSEQERGLDSFLMDYGILIGTTVVMLGFAGFLWYYNREGSEISGPDDTKTKRLIGEMT